MGLITAVNILIILSLISKAITHSSPMCDNCTCLVHDDKFIFDCSHSPYLVVNELYQDANFVDISSDNQTLYDIYYLNMTGLPIENVHSILPNSSVKVLDLTNTMIMDITNEAFKNLQQMVELKLSYNLLDGLSPDLFKGLQLDGKDYPLRSLKILRLDHNRLHTIHNDAFQHIEQTIEELYLQNNPLKIIDLSTLQAIHGILNLRVLDLSSTDIITLPADFLHTPGKLEELYLSNNLITNVTCLGLGMAHVLKRLTLSGNPIVNITEETAFPEVPTLEFLHMCKMPELEVIGDHALCALTGLKELHMAYNPKLHSISESALTHVETGSEVPVISNLKKLYLSNNALTRLELAMHWSALEDLDINGNPWTCEYENQWIVDTLLPVYCKINEKRCKELKCAAPIEMEQYTFYELHEKKYKMRRLDQYGNHPENDGIILVCFMLGLLIGIVVILFGVYAWKRHWFGIFDKSPAAYSRQFYGRTTTQDEYIE